jgi:hypothetical protein
MINLARVVMSPGLNNQELTVFRSNGSWVAGRWVEETEFSVTLEIRCIAYPSTAKELEMVPEGDRVTGAMTFLTTDPLYITQGPPDSRISDKIQWRGELYKIISVLPWADYGYYMAIGERVAGD